MGGELNPQQFTYHVDREEGRYGDDALYVTAADGDRPIGILHLDKDDAVGGGGWQYGVGLLAVGEDHRRQGVASTMYRVAANAIGYNPPHDHQITPALLAKVRAAFEPHCGPGGAHLDRLMHVRLLRRC